MTLETVQFSDGLQKQNPWTPPLSVLKVFVANLGPKILHVHDISTVHTSFFGKPDAKEGA